MALREPPFVFSEEIDRAYFANLEKEIKDGIMDLSTNPIALSDLKGNLICVNGPFIESWGYRDKRDVFGRPFLDFWLSGEIVEQLLSELHENRQWEGTATAKRKDGSTFDVLISATLLHNISGEPAWMMGSFFDVNSRPCLEKMCIEVSEREKRQVGQDLHDGLGQLLSGIAFITKGLENRLVAKAIPEAKDVREITRLIERAIVHTHSLERILYPMMLQGEQIVVALEELAFNVSETCDISCAFECHKPLYIRDNKTAVHLYRIVQESLNNAVRYDNAKSISVKMASEGSKVIVTIKDDGKGEGPVSKEGRSIGLAVMRYRAQLIGASLVIERCGGGGTMVTCSLDQNP